MTDQHKGQTIDGEIVDDHKADRINQAIALHYNGEDTPTVTAKGYDKIAQQIYKIAKENDVPLHEDADLVKLLSRLDVGDEIPKNLYIAVAEVIAFAYLVNGKAEEWIQANT